MILLARWASSFLVLFVYLMQLHCRFEASDRVSNSALRLLLFRDFLLCLLPLVHCSSLLPVGAIVPSCVLLLALTIATALVGITVITPAKIVSIVVVVIVATV